MAARDGAQQSGAKIAIDSGTGKLLRACPSRACESPEAATSA